MVDVVDEECLMEAFSLRCVRAFILLSELETL